ncbi:hypothetical protein V6N12_051302 [Hibiscus sabdariffa]|uniref:Uncharacterized protein n=1 Tax=Hibiscus sabdariffa TaxID=183260 RepID=A0ABR2GEX3_9ROSI
MKRFGLGRVTQWQAGLAELLGSYCLTGSRRIEPALPGSFRPFGFGLCDNGSDEMDNGGCRLKMEGDEAWLFRDEWVLQWFVVRLGVEFSMGLVNDEGRFQQFGFEAGDCVFQGGGSLMPSFGAVEVVIDGGRVGWVGCSGHMCKLSLACSGLACSGKRKMSSLGSI